MGPRVIHIGHVDLGGCRGRAPSQDRNGANFKNPLLKIKDQLCYNVLYENVDTLEYEECDLFWQMLGWPMGPQKGSKFG